MINKGEKLSSSYFINHEDPKIQVAAVNLMSSPYNFSENWAERFEIFLNQKTPDENSGFSVSLRIKIVDYAIESGFHKWAGNNNYLFCCASPFWSR